MEVCVIGMGYIGLPTAAMLASHGHTVIGADIDETLIRNIQSAGAPAEEPGLADLVSRVLSDRSLTLSAVPRPADAFILCLPTPIRADKTADLSYVEDGLNAVLEVLKKGDLLILESTVPPKTTGGVIADMIEKKGLDPRADVDVAFAPERVIPGNILKELEKLDRVIGGLTTRAAERAKGLYTTFVKGEIVLTDATTAEFVKLVENSSRDVNIALANELAVISHDLGIDIWEVVAIANRHPRVNIHRPGPGVGGHCIAVDPYFIIEKAGGKARMLQKAREVNSSMPEHVVALAENMLGGLEGRNVAILGVAYKADVGDPRESPALAVIALLENKGANWKAYDPYVKDSPVRLSGLEEALREANLVLVTTDHRVFGDIKPGDLGGLVADRNILDTRNILDRRLWVESGWNIKHL
jgi:UDP-N-acetyl-D-mannosaminuronic acid dehydrogenase